MDSNRRCARADRGEIAPLDDAVADKICDDLLGFANYGFPESHAWSFALIAYATAYLKAHHTTEFFFGLLNAQPMGFYPISMLIYDARRHGVEMRPPCLVNGRADCTTEETSDPARRALRIGWRFVRGLGSIVLDRLNAAYADHAFTSIADVVSRSALQRDDALALAQADAFSAWLPDRRHAAWEALRASGDVLPFAPARARSHDPVPIDTTDLVFMDYHAIGMSIHGRPMAAFRDHLVRGGAIDTRDLADAADGRVVTLGGLVTVRQRPATAGGTIFLLLEDEFGFANIIVPQKLIAPNDDVVKRATFVLVQGRVDNDGAAISIVGRRFRALEGETQLSHRSHNFR